MKKILISGDSFAADWNKKFKNKNGWVNMLETDFDVTNIAEAGVSEYKIYKQLQKIEIKNFDYVIVSHTSANRIPIDEHPIHKEDILHNNCDLIFSDVNEHIDNPIMKIAYDFNIMIDVCTDERKVTLVDLTKTIEGVILRKKKIEPWMQQQLIKKSIA
jgi:hypothetical protein